MKITLKKIISLKREFFPAFFLLFVLLTQGCKKEPLTNSGIIPNSEKHGLFTFDSTTIKAYTVKEDSIASADFTRQLLGTITDPVFGKSKAAMAFGLSLINEDPYFSNLNDLVVDSTILYLRYDGFSGTLLPQDFKVFLLTSPLPDDGDIYSNYQPSFRTDEIANVTNVKLNVLDSLKNPTMVSPAALKIPCYNLFGEYLLKTNPGALKTNEEFKKFVPGLYITPETQNFGPNEGGILYLNLASAFTYLRVYFHYQSSGATDYVDFRPDPDGRKASFFSHNYSTYEIQSYINNPVKGVEKLYLQSMSSTYIKFDLPHLKQLVAQGPVVINLAKLVIPVLNDKTLPFPPHQKSFVAMVDENGIERVTLDQIEGEAHYGGLFSETNNEINFNLTREIQRIVDSYYRNIEPTTTYHLVPGATISGGGAVNASRTIIPGTDKSLESRFKLIISYTPLKQ